LTSFQQRRLRELSDGRASAIFRQRTRLIGIENGEGHGQRIIAAGDDRDDQVGPMWRAVSPSAKARMPVSNVMTRHTVRAGRFQYA
jgi:hypothetical protein